MATSYLEGYGAGEERRNKIILWSILGLITIAIIATVLYFLLRNRAEKHQIEAFLDDLRRKDYKAGYSLWGCTDSTPCPQYSYSRYLEDWGPQSPHADAGAAKMTTTKSCSAGIIQFVQFPSEEVQLWVERKTKTIGFAPFPVCNPRMQVP